MIPKLRRSFEKLEKQKNALISEVSTWSAERAKFRLNPDCWSSREVLDHLFKVEQACLSVARNNLSAGHPVTTKDRLGSCMVIGVMMSPMRVKVPAAAARVLPEAADLSVTVERWNQTRREMADLLQQVTPAQCRAGLFRHPIAGWMTLPMTMLFISSHLRHHRYQINRLKQATRKL